MTTALHLPATATATACQLAAGCGTVKYWKAIIIGFADTTHLLQFCPVVLVESTTRAERHFRNQPTEVVYWRVFAPLKSVALADWSCAAPGCLNLSFRGSTSRLWGLWCHFPPSLTLSRHLHACDTTPVPPTHSRWLHIHGVPEKGSQHTRVPIFLCAGFFFFSHRSHGSGFWILDPI